jgi:GntR family galactonate operon transcriptional repressor
MDRIGRRGLHDHVVREIGRRIVSGELPSGKPLPSEAALVETLGVSRTALREALRVLGAKGLVEPKPKKGTIVQPKESWNFLDPDVFGWRLDSDELEQVIAELHQLRHQIEPLAASLAASNARAADLEALKTYFAEMESGVHGGMAFVDPDVCFHRRIMAASGNSLLSSLGQIVAVALRAYFAIGISNPRGQEASLPLHKGVLDAIIARDPARARLAMENVILDSEKDSRQIRTWRRNGARDSKVKSAAARRRR